MTTLSCPVYICLNDQTSQDNAVPFGDGYVFGYFLFKLAL